MSFDPEEVGHTLHQRALVLLKLWLIEQYSRRSFVQEIRDQPGMLASYTSPWMIEAMGITMNDLNSLRLCDVRSTVAYLIGVFEGTGDMARAYRTMRLAEEEERALGKPEA